MHVVVCVKPIRGPVGFGSPVLHDADACGMELALRLAEQAGGGVVTAVAMTAGDPAAVGVVRAALALGGHGGVAVDGGALAGCDGLVTAKVLAAAIAPLRPDVVVAGTESGGTVPAQLAELLGLPAVTAVRRAEVRGAVLEVERPGDRGGVEDVVCPLPALVTATAGAVRPRFPTYAGLRAARSAPIEVLSSSDLGLHPGAVGAAAGGRRPCRGTAMPRPPGVVVDDFDGGAHLPILEVLGWATAW